MDGSNSKNDPLILIRRAKKGDAEAFGCLYQIYFTSVFRYIYFRVKDKETAEDLVQTAFLKVFQSLGRYETRNKSPLAYFFTVARNLVIDHWKKRKEISLNGLESPLANIGDSADNPQTLIERADVKESLRRAIQSLTDEQQEVIVLKFINELSNREIAGLLGKTEEAVRQLQCRGLKTLRQYLEDKKLYDRQ